MVVVVCFKQKTAYEMRISDWSSDVCSSDLALLERHGGDGCRVTAFPVRPDDASTLPPCASAHPASTASPQARCSCRLVRGRRCWSACEIGRASCRERVCPYV